MEPHKDLKHIYVYQGDHELWMHSTETWRKNALDKTILRKKKNTSSQPAAPHESYCSKNTVLKTCNRPTIIQNVL